MVDKSLILRKLAELNLYKSQLTEFSAVTLENYKTDWKTQRIVERTLQIMIETCSDIANHIISATSTRPPTSYADTFRVLFENGVISEELSGIMEKMAKFRNVVVHQYEQVDAEIVISILRKHLGDFDKFNQYIPLITETVLQPNRYQPRALHFYLHKLYAAYHSTNVYYIIA